MLGKTSVSMMVLLVAASLIGISSVHQYVEGQTPPPAATPQPQQQAQKTKHVAGNVLGVDIYASSDGKACIAEVGLPSNSPNNLGIRPGGIIELLAPDESICVLFGQSKIGKTIITFDVERLTTFDALPPTIRGDIPSDYQYLYRVHRARM
jgi:hypothetical protein